MVVRCVEWMGWGWESGLWALVCCGLVTKQTFFCDDLNAGHAEVLSGGAAQEPMPPQQNGKAKHVIVDVFTIVYMVRVVLRVH
ncbi:hypothetical protein DTO96_100789 [Ephemeroptericola cinctiostellae]|uniref:Uncharacterized protein n=1 Tax=Ephemeroptericola cinctiostellae TaxID=2268024 RepID=A0A345D9N2_9BURK|nr:hypothetical protein [Ephemeroptericola cinctiostellae]AXF85070.1 hypothetical protein DTO96_100789 [Ephemeroptericola cinctiostellae]